MSLKSAAAVADSATDLEAYNAKRRFDRTREPRGKRETAAGHRFVVQQHDATRMHYDFRLELDGVLLSWAVPKGPSLSPAVKRLAVQTENHPVSYRDFEGEIPAGEYGGGTVIVWDRGRWQPEGDPREGLAQGHLSFRLDGEKLQGRFSLVRTGGRIRHGPKSTWLLFKRGDEHARSGAAAEITMQQPASVITGEPIAPRRRTPKAAAARVEAGGLPRKQASKSPARSRQQAFPAFELLQPQLATLVDRAPVGADWVYEMKLDGYRMLARLDAGKVFLRSRNNRDWSRTFPRISTALLRLKTKSAVLDGEVCFVDDQGRTHFQSLQNSLPRGDGVPDTKAQKQIVFYVFDLLSENGEDLRGLPLLERKQRLRKLLGSKSRGPVVYIDHVHTDGAPALLQACAAGFEGLIAKRADAAYRHGRGPEWLKLKCHRRQEFVIVGMTPPQGARSGFGALLLALRKGDALSYAGKVGTGFSERSLHDLQARLQKLATTRPAVPNPPRLRGVTWVRPELVCEIEFSEMTRDGSIRHPSFQGLREDKPAREVVAERATPVRKLLRRAAPAKAGHRARVAPGDEARARAAPQPVEVEGVSITHPQRVIDSVSGVTKGELARYHAEVSEWFLPYARNRPLAVVRCPQGDAQECFFQKHRTPGLGAAVKRKRIAGNEVIYTGELRGIVELVQFNAIEFHGWGAPATRPAAPDWLVFDLDPDASLAFAAVIEAAQEVREALQRLDLRSFVRTTGGKGLHVVVPLEPHADWDTAKGFAHALAATLAAARPDRYVAQMSKARRKGRVFIDYLRNGRGSTAVLPYSPRARAGTTVAMPLDWRDLAKLDPQDFTVRTVPALLKRRRRDPWVDFPSLRQRLPALAEPASARRRRSS